MFLLEQSTTCLDLIKMVLSKLDVSQVETVANNFGLYESLNGSSIDKSVGFDDSVLEIIQQWDDSTTSKLVFMIRLFTPTVSGFQYRDIIAARHGICVNSLTTESYLEAAEIVDSQLIHLQYIQAVYNVITGQYPTTLDLALELGVHHFLFKFGSFDESCHTLGFLSSRIVEFVPFSLLRGANLEELEERLLDQVKGLQYVMNTSEGEDFLGPMRNYLETIMIKLPSVYGSTFFRCSQAQFSSLPSDLLVGINQHGLSLVERKKSRKILKQFKITELRRWGFSKDTMFYFEYNLDGKEETSVEIGTREGMKISSLLTDYAHAYIREQELEQARKEAINEAESIPVPSVIDTGNSQCAPSSCHSPLSSPIPPGPPPQSLPPQTSTSVHIDSMSTHKPFKDSIVATSAEYRAAVKIQAAFRGFSLRWVWMQEDAAICIQARFRGYLDRCKLEILLDSD